MKYKDLLVVISNLENRLAVLEKQNASLRKENSFLKDNLSKYKNPKNSSNSSIPPSKDENRPKPNQSLREVSGRKPGGQLGRQGKTLEMTKTPDQIVELHPDSCRKCGSSLARVPSIKSHSRQVVDIPPIKAVFTEYRSFRKQCPCGCMNEGAFPSGVNSHVSYGPQTEAFIGYFYARQYLPFSRMKETLNDLFNISISEGGIHYLLERFAQKATPVYDIIKQQVCNASVIGADETGVKVDGEKHWIWAWQTPDATYIAHSDNRAKVTIEKEFPEGFPKSVLVSDGWKPQLATLALQHQSCLPHLLRRLNYLNEKYDKQSWSISFQELFYQALDLKKEAIFESEKYIIKRVSIIQELQKLLEHPPDKDHKELYTFYKRMRREQDHLLVFLYLENVPSDNNASERAIRNVKVKQKISGQFKTVKGAENFAKIRSIVDTTIKNGGNVLKALILIAEFNYQFVD